MVYILRFLLVALMFWTPNNSFSMNAEEYDFGEIKKAEGFLTKNKKDMIKITKGSYSVEEKEFDTIFPFCTLLSEPHPLYAVGKITCQYVDDSNNLMNSYGTGTIISNTGSMIEYITAKHVIKNGATSFSIQFRTSPLKKEYTILAEYIEEKVLIHPVLDIAIVSSKLVAASNSIPEEKLKDFKIDINFSQILGKKKVLMYHYPWAVNDQRFNTGFIIKDTSNHTIPTLPSSSGATLIIDDKIVGIHVEAGDEFPKTKVSFDNEELYVYNHNNFLRLHDLEMQDFQELKR